MRIILCATLILAMLLMPSASLSAETNASDELYALVQNHRAALGLSLLNRDPHLDTSATLHALYLVSGITRDAAQFRIHHIHTDANGTQTWQRAIAAGYKPGWGVLKPLVGEIAVCFGRGQGSPERAMAWWLNSPPHLKSLGESWVDIGIGAYRGPFLDCFVIDFGVPNRRRS